MVKYWDIGIHIQCLTLLNYGVPINYIATWLGPEKSTIYRWQRIVKERGVQFYSIVQYNSIPTCDSISIVVQYYVIQLNSKNIVLYIELYNII